MGKHKFTSDFPLASQDGRTLGDNWLEYKGRAVPPGPEKRRGRQNLTETFQQTSNPYKVRSPNELEELDMRYQSDLGGSDFGIQI